MSRALLIIVGLVILVMGILSVIPGIDMISAPVWHNWVVLVVGLVVFIAALADKK